MKLIVKNNKQNMAVSRRNETNVTSFRDRVKIILDFSHFLVILSIN